MSELLQLLSERVLLLDAAMGSQVQAMDLDVETDYAGQENCTEILNRTRPDLIRGIHLASLEAGSDAVQTNSFRRLADYASANLAWPTRHSMLNKASAEIARDAVDRGIRRRKGTVRVRLDRPRHSPADARPG